MPRRVSADPFCGQRTLLAREARAADASVHAANGRYVSALKSPQSADHCSNPALLHSELGDQPAASRRGALRLVDPTVDGVSPRFEIEQTAEPSSPRFREGPPQELRLLVQCRILLDVLKRHPFRQLEHIEPGRVLHVVAHGEGDQIPAWAVVSLTLQSATLSSTGSRRHRV